MDGLFSCLGYSCARQTGVTLTEFLVVVACIGILTQLAVPAFQDYFSRHRLKSAVEDLHGLMLLAKSEGPIRDSDLSVSIRPDAQPWCLGIAATPDCDCTQASDCTIQVGDSDVLQVLRGDEYYGVTIASNFPSTGKGPTFSRIRGNTVGGTVSLTAQQWEAQVRVSPHGRIRVCAPIDGVKNNARLGYPPC